LSVVLKVNFWGDVRSRAHDFAAEPALFKLMRGSKINDFNLIERLGLLKHYIVGFQIPMNNIVLIAVADALKELVDDDCRVVLCKAAALR